MHTQNQFVVERYGDLSFSVPAISQTQQRDLHRSIERRKQEQFLRNAVAGMFENACNPGHAG